MIWQLVKRDPAWQPALWLTPVAAVVLPFLKYDGTVEFTVVFSMIMFCMTVAHPEQRANLFTAALPLPARHVFLARVLAILAVLWFPAAAGMAAVLALGRDSVPASGIGETALLVTCMVMVALSLYPRQFAAPPRLFRVWGLLCFAAVVPLIGAVPAWIVAGGSAAVSAILFCWTWSVIPPSFQAAPAEAVRAGARPKGTGIPAIVWWPVLRAMFPAITLFWLPMMLVQAEPDSWLWSTLLSFFPVAQALNRPQWVLTLPVSRRALLAATLAISLTPVLLGHWWRLFSPHGVHSLRDAVLNSGAILCTGLLLANGLLAAKHYRFQRLPPTARVVVVFALPAAIVTDAFLHRGMRFFSLVIAFVAYVSTALPSGVVVAVAAAAIPVVCLFWTACRLFAGIELAATPPVSIWESLNKGSV